MNDYRRLTVTGLLCVLIGLGGCATALENTLSAPRVELRDVRVIGLGFNGQTFLLSFNVYNPNPVRLPINDVSYVVRLDGHRFATGTTRGDISVPARGTAAFGISVDLDLISTAPRLLSIVREGVRRDVPYELEGELGLDIPLTAPVRYRTSGMLRLHADGF